MKITQEQLTLMLNNHALWLEDNTKGERFNGRDLDLSNTDLANVNLANAYLYNANLSYAYLYNANLSNANLSNANLSNANLYRADLSHTNLSNADLSNVDLYKANLYNANLSNTHTQRITNKTIVTFSSTKDNAYFIVEDKICIIGCQCLHIDEWMVRGEKIGIENNYSELEIEVYMNFIKKVSAL